MTDGRPIGHVDQMLEAARLALSYIEGLDKKAFLADKRTQQAVTLNIIVIGEAATRLARDFPDFIEQYPHVPWRSMKGMRNRIAHGYFDIDIGIVWDTMQVAVAELVNQLAAIRDEISVTGG